MRLSMGFMSRVWGKNQVFLVPGVGEWLANGRWAPGEPQEVQAVATILPLTSIDLQFYEAGTYTSEDVKVLVNGSINLPIGTQFIKDSIAYEIREVRDYDAIADLRRYVAKRLQAPPQEVMQS